VGGSSLLTVDERSSLSLLARVSSNLGLRRLNPFFAVPFNGACEVIEKRA